MEMILFFVVRLLWWLIILLIAPIVYIIWILVSIIICLFSQENIKSMIMTQQKAAIKFIIYWGTLFGSI